MKGTLTKAFYNRAIVGAIILAVIAVIILGWPRKGPRLTSDQKKAMEAYRPIICDNAYATEAHHEKENIPSIDIPLTPGCFSGFVAVPDKWKTWQAQIVGDKPTDWVAEWYAGWYKPQGPWTIDQINGGMVELAYWTRKLRAEGQGVLRLYRITGDESQTKETGKKADKDESGSEPPQKEIVRHAVPPDSGLGDGYTLVIEECHRDSQRVICSGKVKNTTDMPQPFSSFEGVAVDDQGNPASVNQLAFETLGLGFGATTENLMPNVPVKYTFIVHDPHQNATKLMLTLAISYQNNNDRPIFKAIPIQ